MEEKTMEEKVGEAKIYVGRFEVTHPAYFELVSPTGIEYSILACGWKIESVAECIGDIMRKKRMLEYRIIDGEILDKHGKVIKTLPAPESEIEAFRKALEERLSGKSE